MTEYNSLSHYSLTLNSLFHTQLVETIKSGDMPCIVADNKFHYLLTGKAISCYYRRNSKLKEITHHTNSGTTFFSTLYSELCINLLLKVYIFNLS